MLQRQVYRIARTGYINDLQVETEILPPPGADEVTVKVKAGLPASGATLLIVVGLLIQTPATVTVCA